MAAIYLIFWQEAASTAPRDKQRLARAYSLIAYENNSGEAPWVILFNIRAVRGACCLLLPVVFFQRGNFSL